MDIYPLPGEESFTELTNRETRNDVTEQEAAWLREPDVVNIWRAQLVMLLNKVDAQLSHHRAERANKRVQLGSEEDRELYLQYISQAETWRANALWFRKTLLDRLIEAKAIITYNQLEDYDDTEDQEVEQLIAGTVIGNTTAGE